MASFNAGATFTDGVSNDVTAIKLGLLVTNATPTSGFIQDRTSETVIATNDTLLIGDASDSNNLKRMTVANVMKAELTGTINTTAGTIATLNSTTGTIPTLVATTLITTGTGTAAAPAIVPTGDTNTGIFFPAADTIAFSEGGAEAMRIDSSGNVGIGTNSPLVSAGFTSLTINGTTSGILEIKSNGTQKGAFFNDGSLTRLRSSGTLAFDANNTEAMRIDSSGNVGIGISPSGRLHVAADQNTMLFQSTTLTKHLLNSYFNGDSVNLYMGVEGSSTGRTDVSGTLDSASFFGSRTAHPVQFISNNSARMTIDSSGNVGIGMTPTAQLELSTDSAKKPSTNTWTIASDRRLKTNITNADNDRCYEIVKQVPLKRYTWKSEVYSQEQVKDRSKLGWIAQDVEAVFPKAVGTNRFAYNQVFEDVVTPELDSDGNTVLDENGVAKTKTEKRLVSEDVIEDCKDLNSDQIYAAMYGTIQKLIEKVEFLESKVATLEAA